MDCCAVSAPEDDSKRRALNDEIHRGNASYSLELSHATHPPQLAFHAQCVAHVLYALKSCEDVMALQMYGYYYSTRRHIRN